MNWLDIVLLALVGVWLGFVLLRGHKKRGCCNGCCESCTAQCKKAQK